MNQLKIDRRNNFDFLRILFAISVIVSHSYPLYGLPVGDWLMDHTNLVIFSDLGLGGFFCISGYLVYQSAQRSDNFGSFIWKRILRIFPGLIVNILLIALVLGPIVAGLAGYFNNSSVYQYIYSNVTLFNIEFCIKGVFESTPYGCAINGSLWTIPYEFLFYLLFVAFFLNKTISKYLGWVCIPLFLLLMVVKWRYPDIGFFLPFTTIYIKYIVHFGIWFTAGMALSVTSQYWLRYKARIAAVSFILLLGLFTKQMPFAILYVLWPVFVLSFGNCKTAIISGLDKFGDPSYGVYIYGFVVQQTLMYYCYPSISLMAFLGLSIAISLLLGYISWHLIEKRALRWKKLPAMKMAMATKETV